MYYLNKIVWFFLNPVVVPLVGIVIGAVLLGRGMKWIRTVGAWFVGLSVALLWFESTLTCVCLLGLPLERPYLATQAAESLPKADAIVLLGGGIGKTEAMTYPDMFEGADRIWHAARLFKAEKAPTIIVSGTNDLAATVPLLLDFGVPREAIVVDNTSRNTYENSRFTEKLLLSSGVGTTNVSVHCSPSPSTFASSDSSPSVLLVTSAWHMPRACGNFSKTSLRVIPAACDFSANNAYHGARHFWDWIAPSADMMARSFYLSKEWLGRLAKK